MKLKERRLLQETESLRKLNSTVNALKLVLEPELFAKVLSGNFTSGDKTAIAKHIKSKLLSGQNLVFLKSIMFKFLREIFLMFYYCSCNKYTDEELEFMENDEKERFLLNNLKIPVEELNEAFVAEEAEKELNSSWFKRSAPNSEVSANAGISNEDVSTKAADSEPKLSWFKREARPETLKVDTQVQSSPEPAKLETIPAIEDNPTPKSYFDGISNFFKMKGGGEVDNMINKVMKKIIAVLQGPANNPPEYIGAIITLIQLKPNDVVFALYGIYSGIMKTSLKNLSVSTRAKLLERLFPSAVSLLLTSDDISAAFSSFLSGLNPSALKSTYKAIFGSSNGGTRKATLRARGRTSSRRRAAARAGP